MRLARLVATAVFLMVLPAGAQDAPSYSRSSSPFQNEYELTVGLPVNVRVDIVGVRVATMTVTPAADIEAGKQIKTEFAVAGENSTRDRATVTAVLLIEDSSGRGLERVTLEPFRVRGERSFDERQTLKVSGDALAAASRLYVLLEVVY